MEAKQAQRVRVYGKADDAGGYAIRDFLRRTVITFDWIELTCDADCFKELGLPELDNVRLPVVELPDGTQLYGPSVREIADRLGWVARPRLKEYDVSIYGAGPAGLSAAVYAASEGLRTVLIERHAIGGQAGTTSLIENYLGFPAGISGTELAERAWQQAEKFGAELILMREGIKAEFKKDRIFVDLADGSKMVARANICATGVEWRRLGLDNERRFLNAGFYYGVGTAEAPFCRNQQVFVVGGGNSAGQAVMHFAEYAEKVTMLVRNNTLAESMSSYLAERIQQTPNVEVRYNTEVVGLDGDERLRQITLKDRQNNTTHKADTHRLFVCIGGFPHTEWAKDTKIVRNHAGYLITGPDLLTEGCLPECWSREREPYFLETSVPGSFAAGDVRYSSIKRVASAVGEGAMAVTFVHKYLEETS